MKDSLQVHVALITQAILSFMFSASRAKNSVDLPAHKSKTIPPNLVQRLMSVLIIIVASFAILSSCHTNDSIKPTQGHRRIIYDDGVALTGGVPAYKDHNEFIRQLNLNRSIENQVKFETKIGFRSLLTEYRRAMADTNYVRSAKSFSPLIYLSDMGDIRLNSLNYGIASLINSEGIVIIGAGLYKFEKDKVFSMSLLEGVSLPKAISLITSENPVEHSKLIKQASINTSPIQTQNPGLRSVPQGSTSKYGHDQLSAGYSTFYMDTELSYGWYSNQNFYCSQQEFDPETGYYYCPAENTVFTDYNDIAGITVRSAITRKNCFLYCSTGNANGYIGINEISGTFYYNLGGTSHTVPFYTSSQDSNIYYNVFYTRNPNASGPGDVSDFEVTSGAANFHCQLSFTGGSLYSTLYP